LIHVIVIVCWQEEHSSWTFRPLKMRLLCLVETSGTKYPVTQRYNSRRIPHSYRIDTRL